MFGIQRLPNFTLNDDKSNYENTMLSKSHDRIQVMLVQHNDMHHGLTALKNEKSKESDMSDVQKVNNVCSTSNKESTIV